MPKTFREVKEDMPTTQLICELKARIAQLETINELRSVPPGWMPQPNGEWVRDSQRNGMKYFLKVRYNEYRYIWTWEISVENKEDGYHDTVDTEYATESTVYVCQAMHNADKAFEKFLTIDG